MSLIGIDSGTSSFRAFEYDESTNEFYSLCQDEVNGIPSLYAISNVYGETLIGTKAMNCLLLEPENVVFSIKTKLNEELIHVNGTFLEPTFILNELAKHQINEINNKYALSHFFCEKLSSATLTVPVNFGNKERKLMKEAYEKNGLRIDHMVHEPVAACVYLKNKFKDISHVIVGDFGAGTSDFSYLEVNGSSFMIKDVEGSYVAGDCFDEALLEYMIEHRKLYEVKEEKAVQLLAMKEMKEKLSFHDSWSMNIHYKNGTCAFVSCTKDELEEALSEKYDEIIHEFMKFFNKNKTKNMHLLLTGRSSLSPIFQKKMKQVIPSDIQVHFYDTNIIAKGAAIYAKDAVEVNNFMVKYHYALRINHEGLNKEMYQNLIPAKVSLPYSTTIDDIYCPGGSTCFRIFEIEGEEQKYYDLSTPAKLVHTFTEHKDFEYKTDIVLHINLDKNGLLSFNYKMKDHHGNSQVQL